MRQTCRAFHVLLLLVLMVVAAGCEFKSAKEKKREMVIAITDDSTQKNPYHTNFFTPGSFLSGTLMRADSKGVWQPQAASAVQWMEDGRTLMVTVNTAHRFTNGSPIRAADIAASINAHADSRIGSAASSVLTSNGFISADSMGEGEVHVKFKSRWTPALNFIRQLSIWPETLVSKISADPEKVKINDEELIGAGTHRLTAYVPNEYAVLTPVNRGATIRLSKFSDPQNILAAFKKGEVDLAYAEPRMQHRYAEIEGARVMRYPYPEVITLAFNMETMKDRRLREALTRATNAEDYRLLFARDGSEPASGRIYCGLEDSWNYPEAGQVLPAFDIDVANLLLDKDYPVTDGHRLGRDGKALKVTILTYESAEYPTLVERLAADWMRILRIEVTSEVLQPSQFNDVIHRRSKGMSPSDWHVVLAEWPYQLADFEPSRGDSLLDTSVPSNKSPGRNIIGLRDKTVSDLIHKADSEFDEAVRKAYYQQVHRYLLDACVIKPLYVVQDSWVASARVEGFAHDEPYMKHVIYHWSDKLSIKE